MNKVVFYAIITIVVTFLLFLLFIMIRQGGNMNNKLKTIIGLIIYITLPIILGLIVVKAIKDYNGIVLIIVFGSLVLLSVTLSIVRLIRYNKYKKNK
jgi:heme A synthase